MNYSQTNVAYVIEDPELRNPPESLPTTPGYELEEGAMFNNSQTRLFPLQQKHTNSLQYDGNFSLFNNESSKQVNTQFSKQFNSKSSSQLFNNDRLEDISVITEAQSAMMTLKNPSMNKWRLFSSCCWSFAGGVSDGCVGALLPDIENYYSISYSKVSMIWLGNCIGFILVASISHLATKHLKFNWLVCLSAILQMIQFAIVSSGTKFPAVVFAYFIGGIALALGLSQHNYYISRMDRGSVYLGFFHGAYGIGATVGPLIATIMLSKGIVWHFFFFILLGTAVFNTCFLYWSFAKAVEDFIKWEYHEERQSTEVIDLDASPDVKKSPSDFTLAVKLVKTWILSLFVFFYQGGEVGYGSWSVTYFLDYRNGNKNTAGYISSGFWAGVTLSRFILTPLAVKYLGNRRSIILLGTFAIVFDILSWLIPNVIVGGIMAAFVGVSLGPIYPLMIGVIGKLLPRKVQVISMTIMTAFGSSGGALFPFLIGLMSQLISTYILHPIFIVLISLMLTMWFLLPDADRIEKKRPIQRFWQRFW